MNAEKIFIIANDGKRIKDPITLAVLEPVGEWKPRNSYWLRKITFGDCREAAPPQEKAVAPEAPPAKVSRKQSIIQKDEE